MYSKVRETLELKAIGVEEQRKNKKNKKQWEIKEGMKKKKKILVKHSFSDFFRRYLHIGPMKETGGLDANE